MLTDEQLAEIWLPYAYAEPQINDMLNYAYRLGLLRAAEVCEDTSVLTVPHTHNWTALTIQKKLMDAIRAEAGE